MKLSYEEFLKISLKFVVERIDIEEMENIYNRINEDVAIDEKFQSISETLENDRSIEVGNADFDRELCKRVFRKIKECRYKKRTGIISEEDVDKIIDYCIQEKGGRTNG